MKALLVLQAVFLSIVLSQTVTTIYVDPLSTATVMNGTFDFPFRNLTQAYTKVTLGTFDIVLKSQVYNFTQVESFTCNSTQTSQITITLKALNSNVPLTFNFSDKGQLYCTNYASSTIKNVNFTFRGVNIETYVTNTPLIYGNCYFFMENIYIENIFSTFLYTTSKGAPQIKNLTISNVILNQTQYLFNQDNSDYMRGDYFTLENARIINRNLIDGQTNTVIRLYAQFKYVEVKNGVFEGISFNMKGEELAGDARTDFRFQNVTFKNAKTFLFFESYSTITTRDATFENATDRAIYIFLTDEGLAPQQFTMSNCTFRNNAAKLEGGAIGFQGSKETSYQFSLNVVISNCRFYGNSAALSGGALAFILFQNGNIQITDSEFRSNAALEGGGALYVDSGEAAMTIYLARNTFDLNSGFTGGAVNFESMDQAKITLENNTYTNNFASFEGGIGYVTESNITLKDTNSNGTSNSADFEGGGWSLKGESQSITFENIRFENISAKMKGGCIFNSNANLFLKRVTFKNCTTSDTGSSGGALFIDEGGSIQAQNTIFQNNIAETGASIKFQSTVNSKTHTFDTTELIFDINLTSDISVQNQIQSDKGGLVFNTISIPTLKTPFLLHKDGTISLKGVTFGVVQCKAGQTALTFCIFAADNIESTQVNFTVENLALTGVSSSAPLILSSSSTLSLKNATFKNVSSTADVSFGSFKQSAVKIDNVQLINIDSNFIQATGAGQIEITNSVFDNALKKNQTVEGSTTQFIYLSESSIKVTSTNFGFNSVNYPENGAIRLTNPTSIQFENVTFSENKATNGGSLFIEGPSINGLISNCTFSKNAVPADSLSDPGFGGALYLKNTATSSRILVDQVQSNLTIQKTNFLQNLAYTGGAIYTKEINFILMQDTFDSNQAVSGGALAIDIANSALKIDILQSLFANNRATLYGASVLQLRSAVVANQTGTTYVNETQAFNSGPPASILLRSYTYTEEVLSLIDAERNTDELLKEGLITLEYDSFRDSFPLKFEGTKSGGNFSRLVEITVCDAQGNKLTELTSSEGNVTLSVTGAVYPEASLGNVASLAGVSTKYLINGSVTFLQETNVFAYPTTLVNIGVSVRINHKNLGNLGYTLSSGFSIQLSNCIVGEIFRKETLICDPCKSDYYSLGDPFLTTVCQRCDTTRSDCPGGSQIYPKPGYWRISNMSDNIVECPNEQDSCLGGIIVLSNNKKIHNLNGFCNEVNGYEGNACATCKPGFGKFGSEESCTDCKEDSIYYVKLTALLIIQIVIIVFNV